MTRVRQRGERIRRYIVDHVEKYPADIAQRTGARFGISRQAANKHLARLVDEKALDRTGNTRNRRYSLRPFEKWEKLYRIDDHLAEDVVWREDVSQPLGELPENVLDIWLYGFTEMFNNAIDHSGGTSIYVTIEKTARYSQLLLSDDGIGIFARIRKELNLLDERHAILELSKGKLTTDPDNHTGEGIFFASRMFDDYEILSGGTYFRHQYGDQEDWILERKKFRSGTAVWMKLGNHTSRTARQVFDKYTSEGDFGFTKTVVPVRLAQYGNDKLVSRSQAKRLLARVDRFRVVIFDFERVDAIGQAFADELFRVFPGKHPEVAIQFVNAGSPVRRMIDRARSSG